MLAGLSHRTIGSSDYQDSAVHLCSTGNHVLYVVSVTRAVYVSVVALPGLILNVSYRNGNTTLTLFGSLVDVLESSVVCMATLGLGENITGMSRVL